MKHFRKIIAPIMIAVIMVIYYIGTAVFFMVIPCIPAGFKILMVVVPLILSAVMIGTLISRWKEIQGGEEDDLSQY